MEEDYDKYFYGHRLDDQYYEEMIQDFKDGLHVMKYFGKDGGRIPDNVIHAMENILKILVEYKPEIVESMRQQYIEAKNYREPKNNKENI